MTTTTNFHHVKSMKVEQRALVGASCWITEVIATQKNGETFTLTLFHEGPMPLEGAEFVNFVAQPVDA